MSIGTALKLMLNDPDKCEVSCIGRSGDPFHVVTIVQDGVEYQCRRKVGSPAKPNPVTFTIDARRAHRGAVYCIHYRGGVLRSLQ